MFGRCLDPNEGVDASGDQSVDNASEPLEMIALQDHPTVQFRQPLDEQSGSRAIEACADDLLQPLESRRPLPLVAARPREPYQRVDRLSVSRAESDPALDVCGEGRRGEPASARVEERRNEVRADYR